MAATTPPQPYLKTGIRLEWWLPRWLAWLPRVDVEGLALDRPPAEREREPVSG